MRQEWEYRDGDAVCEGYVAVDGAAGDRRPCVLVAHQWAGLGDHERKAAESLAAEGYVGFALDVYGKGVRGDPMGDNSALMGPWASDRAMLRRRLLAAVTAAAARPEVDPARIAVIGYCFGGLCALDLARSADPRVRAAVSIHGVLAPPGLGAQPRITASILMLHGWNDPLATPKDVLAITEELTSAGADWQLHAYGHALHAFTAEGLVAPERGLAYDAKAAKRSVVARDAFLREIFAGN